MMNMVAHLQALMLPFTLALMGFGLWRLIVKKDRAAGLILTLGLVIIADEYLMIGIPIPGFASGTIRYSELILLMLFVYDKFCPGFSGKGHQAVGGGLIRFSLVIFVAFMFIAAYRGVSGGEGFRVFREIVLDVLLVYLLATRGLPAIEDYRNFVLYLALLTFLIGSVSAEDKFFNRIFLHSELLNKGIYFNNHRQGRIGGLFLNPNFMGAYCVTFIPVLLMALLAVKKKIHKYLILVSLLIIIFALLMTRSRGPFISLIAIVPLMLLFGKTEVSLAKRIGGFVGIILILTILMPGWLNVAQERFNEDSFQQEMDVAGSLSRKEMWKLSLAIISANPLLGVGLGESRFIESGLRYSSVVLDNPHNSYLQIASMSGIIPLFFFILMNMVLLFKGFSKLKHHQDSHISSYLLGMLCGIIAFLICIAVDQQLFNHHNATCYWMLYGLTLSIILRKDNFAASTADQTASSPVVLSDKAEKHKMYAKI